jgi:hypothetical protein
MHGGFLISFHKEQLSHISFYSVTNGRSQHLQRRFLKVFWKPRMSHSEGCYLNKTVMTNMLPLRHMKFVDFGICLYAYFSFCFQLSWYTCASGYQGSALSPDEPDCGWVYSGHDTRVKPNLCPLLVLS